MKYIIIGLMLCSIVSAGDTNPSLKRILGKWSLALFSDKKCTRPLSPSIEIVEYRLAGDSLAVYKEDAIGNMQHLESFPTDRCVYGPKGIQYSSEKDGYTYTATITFKNAKSIFGEVVIRSATSMNAGFFKGTRKN